MKSMRWLPKSEAELERALKEGLLYESHHSDLKRMPSSGKGSNRDIAKDLASLAVDGGALVYGVDEASLELTPFKLAGFRERIDQIARSLVDEPLHVRIEELPCVVDPATGYAIVVVPESSTAPHMVDGRYRGRGDTTNRILSDAEVLRLHARRRSTEEGIEDLLRAEIERDPSPPDHRDQAHMFVVAEPVSGRAEMFLDAIGEENPTQWIYANVVHGRPSVALNDSWSPGLSIVSNVSRTSDGWSAHSGYLLPGRQPAPEAQEDDYFEVELHENGGIRLFCSRASDTRGPDTRDKLAFETLIGGLTLRTMLISRVVSEACGHFGSWDFGLGVTNLRGAVSWKVTQRFLGSAVPFSSDEYLRVTRATLDDVIADPGAVTARLFGKLNRALNGGDIPVPRPAG
jgi:hypothetical protein